MAADELSIHCKSCGRYFVPSFVISVVQNRNPSPQNVPQKRRNTVNFTKSYICSQHFPIFKNF